MKLIYRGNSYTVSDSIQLASNVIDLSPIKLVYQGRRINYIPSPAIVPQDETRDWSTKTLIYRGNRYQRDFIADIPQLIHS